MNVKIYELDHYTYEKYKRSVKDNSKLDFETVQKKLSRNIALSRFIMHDDELDQQFYSYGKLFIRTNHDAVITGIWNNRRPDTRWVLDEELKLQIDKKLGLTS